MGNYLWGVQFVYISTFAVSALGYTPSAGTSISALNAVGMLVGDIASGVCLDCESGQTRTRVRACALALPWPCPPPPSPTGSADRPQPNRSLDLSPLAVRWTGRGLLLLGVAWCVRSCHPARMIIWQRTWACMCHITWNTDRGARTSFMTFRPAHAVPAPRVTSLLPAPCSLLCSLLLARCFPLLSFSLSARCPSLSISLTAHTTVVRSTRVSNATILALVATESFVTLVTALPVLTPFASICIGFYANGLLAFFTIRFGGPSHSATLSALLDFGGYVSLIPFQVKIPLVLEALLRFRHRLARMPSCPRHAWMPLCPRRRTHAAVKVELRFCSPFPKPQAKPCS